MLGDRFNKLMIHFVAIMEVLNEKKSILIKNNPNRAREKFDRIASKPMINPGQYIFQKRDGYTVVKHAPVHVGESSGTTSNVPIEKRKKIERGESSRAIIYSPS